jgi:hypothetical protein
MDLQISYNNGRIDYSNFDASLREYSEAISELQRVCAEDDTTDIGQLVAHYQLQSVMRVREALEALGNREDGEVYSQIFAVFHDFDVALTEFRSSDEEDEEDSDYAEDVLFDKIRNLHSAFRYYCEELKRVCANVDITLK